MLVMEMSNKKQQIPAIRFNGFTDAWEQRKFKDVIVSIQTGTNLLGAESNHGTPLIKMGNIQRGFFSFKKVEFLNENEQVEEKNMVNFGDFLFNTRNTLELVGKGATWFGKNDEYAFNSNIARFTFEGINTAFFNYLYNTPQMIKQVQARAVGTTSVAAVYPKDLNSIKFWIPSANEQQKIGALFKQLDDTIALHQRQLDNYKELKKTMLQQIFNKELRFKDENGNDYPDWRKTLLKKVAKIYDGTHQTPNYKNKGIKFVSVENIKNLEGTTKYISEEDYKKDFKEVPEFGDILMTRIGDVGTSTVVRTYEPLAYYVSLALIKCKNINSEYLNHYIEGEQFQNELWKKILHVAFPKKINKGDIGECMIIYPSVEEQQKIADFLSAIDKQLEKVEQKVELLKEQKKGLMQQMFI